MFRKHKTSAIPRLRSSTIVAFPVRNIPKNPLDSASNSVSRRNVARPNLKLQFVTVLQILGLTGFSTFVLGVLELFRYG